MPRRGWRNSPNARPKRQDVLAAIRRMGVLQIDTINVVARSPYLVLWSRLGDYTPAWLDELLAEGALFEYWSHAMCFLPIEDYPSIAAPCSTAYVAGATLRRGCASTLSWCSR